MSSAGDSGETITPLPRDEKSLVHFLAVCNSSKPLKMNALLVFLIEIIRGRKTNNLDTFVVDKN